MHKSAVIRNAIENVVKEYVQNQLAEMDKIETNSQQKLF
jgi:hypothetical protein